jgi:hypothetical protein
MGKVSETFDHLTWAWISVKIYRYLNDSGGEMGENGPIKLLLNGKHPYTNIRYIITTYLSPKSDTLAYQSIGENSGDELIIYISDKIFLIVDQLGKDGARCDPSTDLV